MDYRVRHGSMCGCTLFISLHTASPLALALALLSVPASKRDSLQLRYSFGGLLVQARKCDHTNACTCIHHITKSSETSYLLCDIKSQII
jgi:hypothetical protein